MASKSSSRRKKSSGSRAASARSSSRSVAARPASSSRKESPDLNEILVQELQEIHSAEKQLSRMIPRLMKAADNQMLQEAIERRLEEGEQLIADVESALEELSASPGRKKNVAAEGLVNDMKEHVQELRQGPALDTALIGALQKTEHYCIAAWGTVKALGEASGQEDLVGAMERALEEGKAYDGRLTQLAESEITPVLLQGMESGANGEDVAIAIGTVQSQARRGRGRSQGMARR